MAKTNLTAVYKKAGSRYIGWIEELPGVNTQAATLRELKANLREAAALIIATNRELGIMRANRGEVTHEPIAIAL